MLPLIFGVASMAQPVRMPSRAVAEADCRYRDHTFQTTAVRLVAGDCYVTSHPGEMLVTVLGSCVAACIRDPVARVGGMNHFMLPSGAEDSWGGASKALRYGNFAMERLINEILERGGDRRRLEVKVFGGANMLKGSGSVGNRNAEFVRAYVAAEGLTIDAQHLGGVLPRRIHFFPVTGRALMLQVRRDTVTPAMKSETVYRRRLARERVEGSIELFS